VWQAAAVTTPIQPWPRPAFQPTGRPASLLLVAFADREVLGDPPELALRGTIPASAPVEALDLRLIRHSEDPDWVDRWRADGLRVFAAKALGDLTALDAATCCYSVRMHVDDPDDLAYLQLAWAVAARLGAAGCTALLDAFAVNWYPGADVADLPPDRPFRIQQEISIIAENEGSPGFGHPVHTRGMVKFGRPDLIAGVPASLVEHTGQILNHLGRMLADGAVIEPGERFRFDGSRTLLATPYEPGGTVPDVVLNNDALLLVDV
jgi:hypothetical protein